MIETNMYRNPLDNSKLFTCKFWDDIMLSPAMHEAILREIVQVIAARYVAEHFQEIVAKLDQNAIVNLAVADAAKKIAEEIRMRPVFKDINVKVRL